MMRTLLRGALTGAVPALPVLVGAALVGAASGLRSQTGLAAVALTTPAVHVSRPVALLSGHRGSVGAATAAVGEIVADKFPGIPSRLSPAGVTSRVLLGALGAVASVATTFAGAWWRRAQSRHRPDWPGAVLEDAVAVGLAWAGCAVAS